MPSAKVQTPGWTYFASKRTLDIVVASIVLLVEWPLLLIIGLAVRLSTGGPSLYVEDRVGLNGKPIRLYRFRTTRPQPVPLRGSEMGSLPVHRTTRVGRFLRQTSLDVLPQFINILKGDLGLVGPRAVLAYEYEILSGACPERFHMRPGMTGYWQTEVLGGQDSRQGYQEMIEFDLKYYWRRSTLLDLRIIWRTMLLSSRSILAE